ncbi:hypothetical protein ACVWZ4_000028 [Bradyrhizobium sp. USDA 4472]
MRKIETATCGECKRPFRFERKGKRPRVYCNVCRVLRYETQRAEFYQRQDATEKRLADRANAIKCHEAA